MEKLPPLTSPYTGGEHATLKHRGGFSRLFLPLSKGELEGVQSKIPNQQAPHDWNLKPKEQHLKEIV